MILFFLCGQPIVFAAETNEETILSEFKASEHLVDDLLLFYDYEDLLVETATRRPTKIQYVAENISVITAEDIAAMNAHSVGEILQTVSGIFFGSYGHEINGMGPVEIQGSEYWHVLVLLDGVRMTDIEFQWPETQGIPVQIIDRIEIIKGPASSAWGSALGGVINIVTKDTGSDKIPSGTVYASYGEGPTQDYRAETAGRAGKVSYYLYGGYQDADGLDDERDFDNPTFYAKLSTDPRGDVFITLSGGYWKPDGNYLVSKEFDLDANVRQENYFIKGQLDAALSPGLKLQAELYYYKKDFISASHRLSTGIAAEIEDWETYDTTGSVKLIREKGRHAMVFGAEYRHGEVDRRILDPATQIINELESGDIDEWALFFNDTIKMDRLTLIPGIRFDHYSIADLASDDEISPSLGMTYKITNETLARATIARGFVRPGISQITGYEGLSNPDLRSETDWSFQAGIESTAISSVHLKADVFYHEQDDVWLFDRATFLNFNGGKARKKGFELNAAFIPIDDLTAGLGYTYVDADRGGDTEPEDMQSLNAKLNYKTQHFGSLLVTGRYIRWGEETDPNATDDIIVDTHYNKDIYTTKAGTTVNIFASVRNLFNGSQYWLNALKNYDRWVEAGVRVEF